jgi:hypothetical protein
MAVAISHSAMQAETHTFTPSIALARVTKAAKDTLARAPLLRPSCHCCRTPVRPFFVLLGVGHCSGAMGGLWQPQCSRLSSWLVGNARQRGLELALGRDAWRPASSRLGRQRALQVGSGLGRPRSASGSATAVSTR